MKKLLSVLAVALLIATGIGGHAAAGVNDFTITNYTIDYQLSKDSVGHSVLQTTENITAEFPQTDQNHGIERAIPNSYHGHPTNLSITSVTYGGDNPDPQSAPYTTYENGGNTVVRIGDPNKYVHGSVTYDLIYTQRDVTAYFSNTNDDEFYWDTNGLDWRVPIDHLDVTLAVDDAAASALTGKTSCYQGYEGQQGNCTLQQNGNTFTTYCRQPGCRAKRDTRRRLSAAHIHRVPANDLGNSPSFLDYCSDSEHTGGHHNDCGGNCPVVSSQ